MRLEKIKQPFPVCFRMGKTHHGQVRRGDFVAAIQIFPYAAVSQRAPQPVAEPREDIVLWKSLNQHRLWRNRHAAEF